MSEIEGSSHPPTQLQLQSPHQIALNRRFPFAPRPSSFDPNRFRDFHRTIAVGLEKDKIPLKPINGTEGSKVEFCEGSVKEGHKGAISSDVPPPMSGKGDKRHSKPKASKRKGFLPENAELVDGSPSAANSCRYDSSLGLLTKKFLNLLQQAEDGTLDLNRAADILDVQKRRIYDITNVLEGVGLIEKKLKNMIRWKGTDISRPKEVNDQIAVLKDEVETLYVEECRVDGMIREMQEKLRVMSEDERNCKWLFVTREDINSLPRFEGDTLIAIKAPHGTSVEVPDPNEGLDFPQMHYQILLRSSMGPIDCYLLSKHEERLEASGSSQRHSATESPIKNNCNYITDETRPLQLMNQGAMTTTCEPGPGQASHQALSDSCSSQGNFGGIVRIVPSEDMDADYLLMSDPEVSITDTWTELAE